MKTSQDFVNMLLAQYTRLFGVVIVIISLLCLQMNPVDCKQSSLNKSTLKTQYLYDATRGVPGLRPGVFFLETVKANILISFPSPAFCHPHPHKNLPDSPYSPLSAKSSDTTHYPISGPQGLQDARGVGARSPTMLNSACEVPTNQLKPHITL